MESVGLLGGRETASVCAIRVRCQRGRRGEKVVCGKPVVVDEL